MAINVLFFEATDYEKNFFKQNSYDGYNIKFYNEYLNETFAGNLPEEILNNTYVISVLNNSSITENVIKKFKNLRVISIRSTVYDNICVKSCEDKNIAVLNLPKIYSKAAAQFAIGLMINLVRKIIPANRLKNVHDTLNDTFIGNDLSEMTLGLIGTDIVGAEICKIANAMGMTIIAHDTTERQELLEKYDVKYFSIDDLASKSDIIIANVEYTPGNYHLCGEEFFEKCRAGIYFINLSKSEIIDFESMSKYLENGKIAGAALDTVPCSSICENCGNLSDNLSPAYLECLKQTDYIDNFKRFDNVIITPRIAALTYNTIDSMLKRTMTDIQEAIKGEKMCRII